MTEQSTNKTFGRTERSSKFRGRHAKTDNLKCISETLEKKQKNNAW